MPERVKVRAVRAYGGRIQGWAINRGCRELAFYREHSTAMRYATEYAQMMGRLAG